MRLIEVEKNYLKQWKMENMVKITDTKVECMKDLMGLSDPRADRALRWWLHRVLGQDPGKPLALTWSLARAGMVLVFLLPDSRPPGLSPLRMVRLFQWEGNATSSSIEGSRLLTVSKPSVAGLAAVGPSSAWQASSSMSLAEAATATASSSSSSLLEPPFSNIPAIGMPEPLRAHPGAASFQPQ